MGVFKDSVLNFRHPVTSDNNRSSAIEFRDPENIDVAVGISFLSYLEADIYKYFRFVDRHLGLPTSGNVGRYSK